MLGQKFIILILVSCIKYSFPISLTKKDTNEISKNSNISTQSRQFPNYDPYPQQNSIPQGFYGEKNQYQIYAKPYPYISYKPYVRPNPNGYYSDPYYQQSTGQNIRENIMNVLYSVAGNDDLNCVPKILCEVASGTMFGRQSGFNLPLNINLESAVGILSSLKGLQSSPILHFGKAALLGYTAKGNSKYCTYAYPECPADPDKLVQYLNNHNGGFFRYFNSPQKYAPTYQNMNPNYQPPAYYNHYRGREGLVNRRIQNNPVSYITSNTIREQKAITFPKEEPEIRPNSNLFSRPISYLRFPENSFKRPKAIPIHNQNSISFERPLPNHKASPFIFPDRTGTGEFIVDSENIDKYNDNAIDNIRNYYFHYDRIRNGRDLFFPNR